MRGVVAHLLLAVVHRRDLDDDREISAGLDRDRHHRHADAEDLGVFAVDAHAVVDLRRIPDLEVDAHVDLFGELDGAHAEDAAGIDDADAAQLDEVADVLRRLADERFARDAADLHGVVRNQPVAALDQLDRRLALADAAVADQQDALAVDLDEHAVARDARRKLNVQIRDEGSHDVGCGFRRAQQRHAVADRQRVHFLARLDAAGKNDGRRLLGKVAFERNAALVGAPALHHRRLRTADDRNALGVEIFEIAAQLHARPHDVARLDQDIVCAFRQIGGLKLQLVNDLRKRQCVNLRHNSNHPFRGRNSFCIFQRPALSSRRPIYRGGRAPARAYCYYYNGSHGKNQPNVRAFCAPHTPGNRPAHTAAPRGKNFSKPS